MAKQRVNKAAQIRKTIEQLGAGARPREVIAALAAKRIKVTPSQVSNEKAALGGSTGGRKRAKDEISMDTLIEVKKLVDRFGLENAQTAMDALSRLL
ncbi:MAG TPA: hypothetical protein VGN12_12170 [Pirellulales bacterium]|jgi:hypothetical protein